MLKILISGPMGCGKTTRAVALEREYTAQGKTVLINEGGEFYSDAYIEAHKPDVVIETRIAPGTMKITKV